MKFITNKGAPDIPLEILEAQESDQLVFFCGAGISYPAGLPSFSKLVDDVYEAIAVPKDVLEVEAIKEGLYDRALGLLEQRTQENDKTGINKVRRAIIERLKIESGADISTHEAILDLSCTKAQKYRVVTTNVDLGFSLAKPSSQLLLDTAPKLPVPKPHKWASAVHLHGVIDDENDANGDHLVFTSGDFGSAYLTERWASKFVTELFSHFTVLFVGYSINDPVLRYMTDAIAAEMRIGYNKFNQPYILASSTPKNQKKDFSAWRAKGVEPIFYSHGHNNLHKTLKAWAAYSRDGLNGKARFIRINSTTPPLPPYDQDESVRRVLDILKEKIKSNDGGITGYPAKVFFDLDDPPAPIDWLPVLHGEGLLSIALYNDKQTPVSSYPVTQNLLYPNKISRNLWRWLLKHLESNELIQWVLDNGVCLHPELKELIEFQLDRGHSPKEPYLTFWRIVTSDSIKCSTGTDSDGYTIVHDLKTLHDELALKKFCNTIAPKITLKKSFYWPDLSGDEDGDEKRSPYDSEVSIELAEYTYKKLIKLDIFPDKFTSLLVNVTSQLNQAMELWAFLGRANEVDDRSHWDLVSIADHPQNKYYSSWVILIQLCRDLWVETFRVNQPLSQTIIDLWKTFRFPVFRRLVFHAYTVTEVENSETALIYLLEKDGWWLWSITTQREKYRLLAKLWPAMSAQSTDKLIGMVLKGPPRDMYRVDLTEEKWQGRYDRDIWHLLTKLNSFGRNIPDNAQNILQSIQDKYKNWNLAEGERDEFTHWSESRIGYDLDLTVDDLFELSIPDLVDKLLEDNKTYNEGRCDAFRAGVKDHSDIVLQVLHYVNERNISANKIWHAALVGLADLGNTYWSEVARLLVDMEDDLYIEEPWAIAWWTRKASKVINPNNDEETYFWRIANRLIDNAAIEEFDDDSDIINVAINRPVGILTEAVIDRFTQCKLEADEGIPEPEYLAMVTRIMTEDKGVCLLGRVILSSRLQYFYAIDNEWTTAYLLPKFDWSSNNEAKYIWQGYLWAPRITADLARELRDYMLEAIRNSGSLEKHRDHLYQLFIVMCLEYPDLYTVSVQREAMTSIGKDGLEDVSEFFWRSISSDQEDNDIYWANRIKPFIERAWPKIGNLNSSKISNNFALMCIQLDDAFSDAVNIVKPFLMPVENLSFFVHHLNNSPLIQKQPLEVFELLSAVFSTDTQWPDRHLREIIAEIKSLAPEVEQYPKFIEINEYLLQHNL